MASSLNGSGPNDQKDKLIRFPDAAERARLQKEKEQKDQSEESARRAVSIRVTGKQRMNTGPVPFFNFSKIPPFTGVMFLVFIAVHVALHLFFTYPQIDDIHRVFGFTPAFYMYGGALPWPAYVSPITHQFMHGDFMHLFFNSTSLLVMGMFFEKIYGWRMTAFFFFACGLAGAAIYFALDPHSATPIIGASGGISGLFGAVTILLFQQRPQAKMSKHGPWPLVFFWLAFMIGMGSIGGSTIAWQAHVGGFLSGIALLHAIQRRKRV